MINKDLYMLKVAGWNTEDTSYAGEFMGMVPDNRGSGAPITRVHTQHYSSTVVPFWSVDKNSLSKNKISIDWDDVSDNNAFFTTHYDVLKAFKNAGENSGLFRKYYQTLDDYGGSGLIKWSPREQYEFFKKHKILNAISGFPAQGYENYKKAMDKLNQRNNIDTSAYDADFAARYGKAITPERYNELQRLQGTPEYKKKLKEYVTPWARDYSKQKTAALAEELNPVPKSKRKRSAFQRFVDTLSTNKAKHVAGVAGGISGMITGKELLHSNLTPMRVLGGVGVVGGAALGAKNIYGLYNDYFD